MAPRTGEVFRGKFRAGLGRLRARHALRFAGHSAHLAGEHAWGAWLRDLLTRDWVVYAKPPFGGPERGLQYLRRYTHRVAIANHRLVSIEDGAVRFRWRDDAHPNRVKVMALPAEEVLRRFLLHVVPSGFMRIRHFGLLANRHRTAKLARCRRLLTLPPAVAGDPCASAAPPAGAGASVSAAEPPPGPVCGGGPLRIIEMLAPVRGVPP